MAACKPSLIPAVWTITTISALLIALKSSAPSTGLEATHVTPIMPSMIDWLNLTTTLRFVAPQYSQNQWQEIDSEIKDKIAPIHYGLSNNVITPQEAGLQLSETLYIFLQTKPEFVMEMDAKEGYKQRQSKTLEEAKQLKNKLRKKIRQHDCTPEDRRQFGQAVRYHNFIQKQQKKKNKENATKHQEKMFRDNFWEFSRKLCKNELDKSSHKPTFDKACADTYYPMMYSSAPTFAPDDLNWFPYLRNPETPVSFNMEPIKPKEIRKILSQKKSSSAPGIDGITYGVLRHLPSVHHLLATLYSKILINSPEPPALWQQSNVSLIYKRNEPSNPKNFRMIALTSVIGKIYHQILSDRILQYLIGNGYINDALQKAFIKNVNGTVEHNQLLQEVLTHARRNHKTCHVTFFDLKDAFGSISHALIDEVLTRYKLPENVKTYIRNLYLNISGSVVGPGWKSKTFTFKRGVFQGDPLSPTIFICVFNPLLEYLMSELSHGYHLDKNTPIISTPFADDFNVITSNARSHQRILKNVEKFAKSMNLCLEPTKCKSLSICSGSSKLVKFKLSDSEIDSIINSPEKFLGAQITYSGKQEDIFNYIFTGIKDTIHNIDQSLIRDEFKLKVYSQYLLPAIRFKLTVHEISATNLSKLDALGDRFIKKWLHIPPSGTLAIVHTQEGLNIKSLSHIYKEAHAVSHTNSRLKADRAVNVALESRVAREASWTRKGSITSYSENHYQKANTAVHMTDQSLQQLTSVKRKVKQNISDEFQNMWHDHIKELTVQGKFLQILHLEQSHISWRSLIYNLPRGILQFAVNACIDTLATNANLKRWGKKSNAKCTLCRQRETLHHTLNNCSLMLDRYLWRHNSVLMYIYKLLNNHKSSDTDIYIDIAGHHTGISTIPTEIVITSQKPDLVIVNKQSLSVTLFELSIPFETNIKETHERKVSRYQNLVVDIEDNGYHVDYYPVEVGSRGFIDSDNTARLKSFFKRNTPVIKYSDIKTSLVKIVLVASYIVYHSKYDEAWSSPSYVNFSDM